MFKINVVPSVFQNEFRLKSFFIVCRSAGKLQILFLMFAKRLASLSKDFRILSVATACNRCAQSLVTRILFHLSFAIGNHL